MIIRTFGIICFLFFSSACIQAEDWQAHWFNGAIAYNNRDFNKAIEEYSLAIGAGKMLNQIYLDRAKAYFKNGYFNPEAYTKAIEDLSKVLESQDICSLYREEAIWLRAQAYFLAGSRSSFLKESERSKDFFSQLQEDKNYAIFKMGELMLLNKELKKAVVNVLLLDKVIDSENDIIFTTSGVGIVKKVNGCRPISELF